MVLITFLAASTGFLFTMFFKYLEIRKMPSIMYAANGILIGLIVITPVAGYVGPGSAVILRNIRLNCIHFRREIISKSQMVH